MAEPHKKILMRINLTQSQPGVRKVRVVVKVGGELHIALVIGVILHIQVFRHTVVGP